MFLSLSQSLLIALHIEFCIALSLSLMTCLYLSLSLSLVFPFLCCSYLFIFRSQSLSLLSLCFSFFSKGNVESPWSYTPGHSQGQHPRLWRKRKGESAPGLEHVPGSGQMRRGASEARPWEPGNGAEVLPKEGPPHKVARVWSHTLTAPMLCTGRPHPPELDRSWPEAFQYRVGCHMHANLQRFGGGAHACRFGCRAVGGDDACCYFCLSSVRGRSCTPYGGRRCVWQGETCDRSCIASRLGWRSP